MVVLLTFALLFGGASRLHELRLAVTELAALPLLVIATLALLRQEGSDRHRFSLTIMGCLIALPILQLVPLPPGIWTSLPGRDQLVLGLDVAGINQPWAPLSLTPDRTWRSLLALLPPVAMFLGVLSLTSASPGRRLAQAVIFAALLSTLLGAAQLASGGDRLYPWPTTNAGNVTGFFANRNHLATLCLISIPFAAVLGAAALRRRGASRMPVWLAVLFMALIAVALGVIRSRAGVILFMPVVGASLLAAWAATGRGRPRPMFVAIGAATALAVTALAVFAAPSLIERFDTTAAREGRFENWPIVASAAEDFLPFGSGLGSFDAVYRSVEPLDRLDATFFNQAHNDYLESWLETGWFGMALVVAFLIWFGRRTWTVWRAGATTHRDLQRAATIAIGAILLHSAVDYPLRTVALATLFALCCGLLELAVRPDDELVPSRTGRRRSDHR